MLLPSLPSQSSFLWNRSCLFFAAVCVSACLVLLYQVLSPSVSLGGYTRAPLTLQPGAPRCSAEQRTAVLDWNRHEGHMPPLLQALWPREAAPTSAGDWVGVGSCLRGAVDRFQQRVQAVPGLAQFLPCDLLEVLAGRTLWVVGDSQMLYFYFVLREFLRREWRTDGSQNYNEAADDGGTASRRLLRALFGQRGAEIGAAFSGRDSAAAFSRPGQRSRSLLAAAPMTEDVPLTEDPARAEAIQRLILKDWCCGVLQPRCTLLNSGGRVCFLRANKGLHVVQDVLPNFELLGARHSDVMVVNFGLWHHIREGDYESLVSLFARAASKLQRALPHVVWRDNSPQHFMIEHGEFPHPDEVAQKLHGERGCQPIEGVSLLEDGRLQGADLHVLQGGWRNKISNPILDAWGIPVVHTWNESVPMWDAHTPNECSHFCAPGVYNFWIWQTFQVIRRVLL